MSNFKTVQCIEAYIISSVKAAWGGKHDYVYGYEHKPIGDVYFSSREDAKNYIDQYNQAIIDGQQQDLAIATEKWNLPSTDEADEDEDELSLQDILYQLVEQEKLSENQIKNLCYEFSDGDGHFDVSPQFIGNDIKKIFIPIDEFKPSEIPAIEYKSIWEVIDA